jgi:hypothetical protein
MKDNCKKSLVDLVLAVRTLVVAPAAQVHARVKQLDVQVVAVLADRNHNIWLEIDKEEQLALLCFLFNNNH